ncbi:MAG TPA: hypothetical protein EYO01_06240 [Phycisphaerales bacterium]|nr:hypothetical protein [Phycisphaerales bacterium]HIN83835.1 hypothetical protein [Phycisphaerales bacterium]HIO53278.1 hypothetical protein [Phycisphaerales bacterium]
MSTEQKPRFVMIVTDGPLMAGRPSKLANRSAIHLSIISPPLPPAAIATTIVTGVSPLIHGIVTKGIVDSELLTARESVRTDRRFQTFWDESDLEVKLINWPATIGDGQVTNLQSFQEFQDAKECLDAEIVGILLPLLAREQKTHQQVLDTQEELENFLECLPKETNVLLVHRRTGDDGIPLKSMHTLCATFLVDKCEFQSKKLYYLESVGAASYLLAGVPCPIGVAQPKWQFLPPCADDIQSVFPKNPLSDTVDWPALIQQIIQSDNTASITLLTQRFATLVSLAFKKQLWDKLEFNSACLVQLRGKPFDYWMLILALEQQGKIEELQPVTVHLEKLFPNVFITRIAKTLVQFDEQETLDLLQTIEIEKMGIYHALGLYGRSCLKAGLMERGEAALVLATQKGVAISADRVQLAKFYFENGEYEKALRFMKRIGESDCELSWQVLRLKILDSLNRKKEALLLAKRILGIKSTHEVALKALEKFS